MRCLLNKYLVSSDQIQIEVFAIVALSIGVLLKVPLDSIRRLVEVRLFGNVSRDGEAFVELDLLVGDRLLQGVANPICDLLLLVVLVEDARFI